MTNARYLRYREITSVFICICLGCIVMTASIQAVEPKPRARDLGIPFDGTPGPLKAIGGQECPPYLSIED